MGDVDKTDSPPPEADPQPLGPRLLQWMADRNRFAEQNEDGVDLSLIESALEMTPTQRARLAYRRRQDTLRLLSIGQRNRENAARKDRRSVR